MSLWGIFLDHPFFPPLRLQQQYEAFLPSTGANCHHAFLQFSVVFLQWHNTVFTLQAMKRLSKLS